MSPLTWEMRATGMPLLPGPRDGWIAGLDGLIAELSGEGSVPVPRGEPPVPGGAGAGGLDRHQLQRFVRAGLLRREGAAFRPSAAALEWRRGGEPGLLVEILHRHVRFVGELMAALADGPRTHEQLLDLARERFDLPWETPGPVRDRTAWLAVTRMVDLFGGRLHLTDAGREVLGRLVLGGPEADDAEAVAPLPPTVGAVAELLGSLDGAALRARADGANLYVPGGSANGGRLDALEVLTEAASPSVTDADFVRLVQETFPNARTSATARTAKDTLKALGLIERTSSETWSATPAALGWLESGEPLDLARIVHASIAFFGELLGELDRAIRPTSGALAERSARYLPNRGKPLTRSAVNTRLSLLEACGLVTRLSQTTYRTTPLGRAFRDSLPCLGADDAASGAPVGDRAGEPQGASPGTGPRSGPLGADIAAELEDAARDSANHRRLERAAVVALGYLGLPGEHVGGSGAADGRVRFGVGAESRLLAVEAKTAATGRVVDQSLFGLAEHRADMGAEATLLIGPGFERRMLKEADDDPAIAVIETGLLAEVVRRQEQTPLTPAQLAPLFDPRLRAAEREDAIRGCWEAQEIRGQLEYALVDILNVEAEDPLEEGGWLDLTSVRRELRTRGYRVEETEVVAALEFLASARVGVLQGSGRGYRCTAGVHTAGQRIRALGHQWAAAAELHHRNRPAGGTGRA
ncbi:hypothetical protein [Streptomyces sp. NPDC018031]|uniref:hypothetical protein n=1 Tax=Streptomyces sp. NPDC018031 TaxID=3365033 RepID=UPI0037A2AA36